MWVYGVVMQGKGRDNLMKRWAGWMKRIIAPALISFYWFHRMHLGNSRSRRRGVFNIRSQEGAVCYFPAVGLAAGYLPSGFRGMNRCFAN